MVQCLCVVFVSSKDMVAPEYFETPIESGGVIFGLGQLVRGKDELGEVDEIETMLILSFGSDWVFAAVCNLFEKIAGQELTGVHFVDNIEQPAEEV